MGFRWKTKRPEALFTAGVIVYERAINEAMHEVAEEYAPYIEADMKALAPWTDRTGNARRGLRAEVPPMGVFGVPREGASSGVSGLVNQSAVVLSYNVDYGRWLELANAGRWAIIGPTLDKWGPILWRAVKERMR